MTQEEIIVWHKYSDEKPFDCCAYLICYMEFDHIEVKIDNYIADNRWDDTDNEDVLGWAYLPKGWKKE